MKKMFSIVATLALTTGIVFISSCSKKSDSTTGVTSDNMDNQTYQILSITLNNQDQVLPYVFGQAQSQNAQPEYLQAHVSDPAKSINVSSVLYMGSLINNTGFQRNFTISKTDAPTAVDVQFSTINNYETCGNTYPPNDLVQANMIQYNNVTTSPVTGGGTTTTVCYTFSIASLNGTYKISGDANNVQLEMVQQGMVIDILLQRQKQ